MAEKYRPIFNYHNGIRTTYKGMQKYYCCERCGMEITAPNAAKRKYCEECSEIVKKEKNAERMKSYKERHNIT